MSIVVSGIRPTGKLHLGNYFGAIRNFICLQEEHTCYFFVADYHSLTTHPKPNDLSGNVMHVVAEFLGCGLDPEKAILYLQSDLPETLELYLFFNMNAYLGELMRVTTFKEKARLQPHNVNAGLLTYPTLMAADILIHKGEKVPVGKDQEQHLEMTRNFAQRFNRMYEVDFFPEPVAFNFEGELIKVPGLDGSGKMGKSEGEHNAIYLTDDDKTIEKKIMRAVTDTGPTQMNQPPSPPVANLFTLMSIVSDKKTVEYFYEQHASCTIRYGEMKKQLAADMINFITPIREKILSIAGNKEYIIKVIREGREKARISARNTIRQVREIIGFKNW
ncbi:MAG: tryptophan--tRNA ligase [Bacteroidales bacterium]|nr:tryptophan--tRNA ligase [Bacteroidales bacterium]